MRRDSRYLTFKHIHANVYICHPPLSLSPPSSPLPVPPFPPLLLPVFENEHKRQSEEAQLLLVTKAATMEQVERGYEFVCGCGCLGLCFIWVCVGVGWCDIGVYQYIYYAFLVIFFLLLFHILLQVLLFSFWSFFHLFFLFSFFSSFSFFVSGFNHHTERPYHIHYGLHLLLHHLHLPILKEYGWCVEQGVFEHW